MLRRDGESCIDTFLGSGHVLHTVVDPPLESVEVDGPGTVVSPRYQQYCVGQLIQKLPSPGGEAGVHRAEDCEDLLAQLNLPVHLRSAEALLVVGEYEAVRELDEDVMLRMEDSLLQQVEDHFLHGVYISHVQLVHLVLQYVHLLLHQLSLN